MNIFSLSKCAQQKSCFLVIFGGYQQKSILTEQAREEQRNPVLPKLKEFLQGEEILHTCHH